MASIAPALARIKQHLDGFIPHSLILETFRSLGFTWRNRKLTPVLWVHLLLLQLLGNVAYGTLRHLAGLEISAQALCQAQRRLPLQLLLKLVECLCGPAHDAATHYRGHRVTLADGMSFLVQDTPDLAKRFGHSKNHRGYSRSFPVPKLLALVDASTGMLLRVISLPWARQEHTCLSRLLGALSPGDLVLGDRGLVGFVQLVLMIQQGLSGLLRLPRDFQVHGRGNPSHRLVRRLGRQDLLVRWYKGRKPGWISRLRFDALPQTLELLQIAFRICRPGYRTQWAWLVTTLTDPAAYPAEELVNLYTRRWQVEVYFRDLKQTLGFKKLHARTVEGVRKQILGMVILYNLIRSITTRAAVIQNVEPDRVSFNDPMQWLLWSDSSGPPRLIVHKHRVRPTQPRLTKGRRRFPRLSRPRHTYLKPPAQVRL